MGGEQLDHEQTKHLAKLVERLTTSGNPVLDPQQLKQFKKICKTSDLYVEHAFRLLMTQLGKEHAEIRLSTFQVIDEVFNRSHIFRELLVSDFQNFLELTVETDQQHQPLPPPKAAANKLKSDALKAVQQWKEKYGSAYKKLSLGYNFLQTCKHVNFNNIRAQSVAEQRRREQEEERKQKAFAAKLEKARKEIAELQKEITDAATEAENCIDLLLPTSDLLFTQSDFVEQDDQKGGRNKGIAASSASESSELHIASSSAAGDCVRNCSERTDVTKQCDSEQSRESEIVLDKRSDLGSSGVTTDSAEAGSSRDMEKTEAAHNPESDCKPDDEKDSDNDSDDDEFEDIDADEAEELGMVQTHGLGSRKYNLEIEIGTTEVHLTETDDNRDLYHSLKDSNSLVSLRYLPQVVKWLEVLGKTGGRQSEIKAMIDLKLRLEHIKTQCSELRLVPQPDSQEQQSDSDEEMEEVPEKEGYEPVIPAHLRAEYGLEPLPPGSSQTASSSTSSPSAKRGVHNKAHQPNKGRKRDKGTEDATGTAAPGSSDSKKKLTAAYWNLNDRNKASSVADPTSRAANMVKLGLEDPSSRPSTSKGKPATVTSETEGRVPTLTYGMDLEHWGASDKIEPPSVVKNDSLHRFWVPAEIDHEKPSQNDIAAVINRTFHYTGQFVPVKWKCRAPMRNGKLCERMDRVKCPFHGKIIPRDESGHPAHPEDIKVEVDTEVATKSEGKGGDKDEVPPWLDAELQADIEAATGHDLGSKRSKAKDNKTKESKGKGKGKGKKKYEGLTDIKASKNTTRARLEAKVFNKGSQRRVASALNAADYKRVRDKFGNQYNYAINN